MSQSPQRLLPVYAAATALGAAAAMAATGGAWLPAALWHLVFAVGALPMILSAMGYFVPVLTRSGEAPRALALAPLAALAAGLGIVGYFLHGTPALRLLAPWLALAATAGFAVWMARRWRGCLGHPNPCLAWYAAALGLLALGLLAVALSPWSAHPDALRRFHLHINTLGFMGLTALGTLQVLLPTVAGHPDPEAALRLKRDLKWSAGGALLTALGAAILPPLTVLGVALYAVPILRLMAAAWKAWRPAILGAGTTVPLLFSSLLGLLLVLVHGAFHASGHAEGRPVIVLFVVGFLLPLVSGAAGHLLPVWLRPGQQNDWHRTARAFLARGARQRALLFPCAALLAAAGFAPGYGLAALGALWLVAGMLRVALTRRS